MGGPSLDVVNRVILGFMFVIITAVIILTAIAFFSYKYKEEFYSNARLGHIYIFDAIGKYKKTVTYALVFALAISIWVFMR